MTTAQAVDPNVPRSTSTSEILLDGLVAGIIGALLVAGWFLVLDLMAGRALYTPALLGRVLLYGSGIAAKTVAIEAIPIAAYTAFHFAAFIGIGIALSYLMTLFERFPIMFFVLLVLFVCLQVGFFFMDAALGAQLMGRLKSWTVLIANLLAAAGMALYLWRRHPSVLKGVDKLWEDEP